MTAAHPIMLTALTRNSVQSATLMRAYAAVEALAPAQTHHVEQAMGRAPSVSLAMRMICGRKDPGAGC
jgi:hypothetical protein